jgi:predicted GNAT family acetyltransferase
MSQVEVRNAPEQSRYEVHVDGRLAGFAAYSLQADTIVFTHTEVDDDLEGQGIGSALARGALDDVRAAGERRVVPRCPFIAGWIDKHPEYADLVQSGA